MADPLDRPEYSFSPGPPPEASRFLKNKGLRPSFGFEDVEPEEHAVAFAVAKVMEVDLLEAMQTEILRALDEGLPLATFQKSWRANPRLAEWWGKREMTDPLTGEVKLVQLGSPRRLRTIYNANIRSARAAGQWERIERTKAAFPYLEYRTGPSEQHRPHHLAKAGTILPIDSPFWDDWMPPNGWGCKCWVRQVTKAEATRRGVSPEPDVPDRVVPNERTGDTRFIPLGIDPGWQRNPGKLRLQHMDMLLREKIENLPEAARKVALRDIATSWRVMRILRDGAPGKAPVAMLEPALTERLGARTSLIDVSSATIEKQRGRHPELTPEDYARLVDLLEKGKAIAQSETHLAFVEPASDLPWVAVLKRTLDGREVFLVSLYKSSSMRYISRLIERGEIWRE